VNNEVMLIKLQPNQDLVTGLEDACREAGISRACILSGVGSINDAYIEYTAPGGSNKVRVVNGPGLEVAGVTGAVELDSHGVGVSQLTAWVCDSTGDIVGGRLQRGHNIICITFEFVLQTWSRVDEPTP
jgi:predicted DNA-binding protein with PD1-like motif